jgi:pyruvate carboxylase
MIHKLLVANRGEIAIRAFRAATQLGIATVAVHTYEDRGSLHRVKADEAYEIGERGHPVRGYLDIESLVETALASEADAIYPGYGFLSESPELAEATSNAGLAFVGPSVAALELTGNKMRARLAAERAGLPVPSQSQSITSSVEGAAAAADIGFPLFVKAASGGGGRGLRRVTDPSQLDAALASASSEAESAFGDGTVFLEEALEDVRHIEVQVLGAADGVIHLFERDCSVQRRYQKVIEIAPAPHLDPGLRETICAAAVRFAESISYTNAGTVEFLVNSEGRYVFIEMNPRIQVEHTVTEEITDVDLVESQLLIAGGKSLADLQLGQDGIKVRGAALQCRVTTEDPSNDFRPDTGRVVAFRAPAGGGVRLDDGGGYAGAEITPYFDSLLAKVTCRGPSLDDAIRRARRALAEFRVRGVRTNLGFLRAVLDDEQFLAGEVTTSFIDDRPMLTSAAVGADRATRLLRYLADVTVNRPNGSAPGSPDPASKLPQVETDTVPMGSRDDLRALGAREFAARLRSRESVAVTDTTLRDAHQSILATRVRTIDLENGAHHVARMLPGLFSLECWGGATYDAALRFLSESPWDRLAQLREAAPNLCLQMLLRGRNTVGYAPYPDVVCRRFVATAQERGIDIFRIFDALNSIDQMRPAIDAVLESGAVAEGTICYSGDLSDPAEQLYTLSYYLDRAEELVEAEVHILCIKDMAGVLRVPAATTLVEALRSRFDLPVHLHTHDTAGGQLATYVAAIEAGVDAVDGAAPPLSGMTSQPSLSAIVAAVDHTPRSTGLSLGAIGDLEPYWESVRRAYAPFEAGLRAPTGTVYRHEIPGGQLSNLRQQAIALGLGDRFEQIEDMYAACNEVLGRPIKVTPTSKVVGDLALHLVASGTSPQQLRSDPGSIDLPDSVIAFLRGNLGEPPGGFPEPFRSDALAGRAESAPPPPLSARDLSLLDEEPEETLDRLLFPEPARSFVENRDRYGDLSVLPTLAFLYGLQPGGEDIAIQLERGVTVHVGLDAVGEPNESGERTLMFRLNGQIRPIRARDLAVATDVAESEKADPANPGDVAAPFRGVVTTEVEVGEAVRVGQVVAKIEAMKMESSITAPLAGTIARVIVADGGSVEPGDLLCEIRPEGTPDSPTVDFGD